MKIFESLLILYCFFIGVFTHIHVHVLYTKNANLTDAHIMRIDIRYVKSRAYIAVYVVHWKSIELPSECTI